MRSFRKNKRGVIWVWCVFFLALFTLIIVWVPLSWAAYAIIDAMTSSFNYPEPAKTSLQILTYIGTYSVLIMVFGLIAWALKSSTNPQMVGYPVG
jgi:hypothetical protein